MSRSALASAGTLLALTGAALLAAARRPRVDETGPSGRSDELRRVTAERDRLAAELGATRSQLAALRPRMDELADALMRRNDSGR